LIFDIDGVIVRGRQVLSFAPEAFRLLVDRHGNFKIPTVFLTNAGNVLRQDKAAQLSNWLGIKVDEDQVVMAHSPLRLFRNFHDKRVLVSGQGPVADIAKNLGFHKVTTLDECRAAFPILDAVDHKRRVSTPSDLAKYFPRIEAIVLFGEPIRWETALQLLVDVLMTNGLPSEAPREIPRPHLPILACNMDLQWMAEACMPRVGHGSFMLCLETLYHKITGHELLYTALIGKPSEITYHHSERMLVKHARKIGNSSRIRRIYAIGDNLNTDIFGSNLYNEYLSRTQIVSGKRMVALGARSIHNLLGADPNESIEEAEQCISVLVETGVFSRDRAECLLDHSPRDFLPVEEKLRQPHHTTPDVLQAINFILRKECYE
jgi:HAD superfamily hydrolase (TIGR01456 family)